MRPNSTFERFHARTNHVSRAERAGTVSSVTEDPTRTLDDEVAACAAAHQRLNAVLADVVAREALDPRAASLLPGWTVGHVLTHLARNADALRGMIEAAAARNEALMYPSAEAREEGISAGALRSAEELVDDVRLAAWKLESSWARLDSTAWNGFGITARGRIPVHTFPWRRWREVEVHGADLGLAELTPANWSPSYVAADVPRRIADIGGSIPDDVAAVERWRQLAWLLGRDAGPGLPAPPTF
jgi:maleylpyruvate isomerase